MKNQWFRLYGTRILLGISLSFNLGCSKRVDDYGQIKAMRHFSENIMRSNGAVPRTISEKFSDYRPDLSLLFRLLFGTDDMRIHLLSYESERFAVASFTQMEVPANSDFFLDLAFEIRPSAHLRAPIFHGDVIKPMPGVDGMFAVDFYNTNASDVDVDSFLGDQLAEVQRALKMVEPYQKTEQQGRGKLTKHLKPFKSKYRIELHEPEMDDKSRHSSYFLTVGEAYRITLRAYLMALSKLAFEQDPKVVERNKKGHDLFIETLHNEDIAAKLSRWMFGEDYEAYFMEGFWGKGHYGIRPSIDKPE